MRRRLHVLQGVRKLHIALGVHLDRPGGQGERQSEGDVVHQS